MELLHGNLQLGDKIILQDFSLSLPSQGVLCLSGPSGCGKTSLLRVLAGLTPLSSGSITHMLDGRMVFQEDRLIPWLSVEANLTAASGISQAEARRWLQLCRDLYRGAGARRDRPLPGLRCLDRRPQQVHRLRPVHHQVRVRRHPSGSRPPRVLHDGQIRAKAPQPRQVRFEARDQNQIWEEIKNATNKRTAQRTVGQRASPRRGEVP